MRLVLVVGAALLAACGGASPLDQVGARAEGAARARPYASIHAAVGHASAVVVGRFAGAEPGASFDWDVESDPDREVRIELAFNDPGALVSTAHARFVVGEVLAGGLGPEVVVGLAFDAPLDVAALEGDLAGLGEVVLFLHRSPVFDYAPEVWAVMEDGALLAVVGDGGELAWPFLADPDELNAGVRTLADLRRR